MLDLDASNGKYMEDMVDVFDQTQTFERRRLEFVKSILLELHNSADYSQNQALVFSLYLTGDMKRKSVDLCNVYVLFILQIVVIVVVVVVY